MLDIQNILETTLLGLFFGTFGTTLGGIIGVTFKGNSAKFLCFVLQFAAGLMLAVICFELIPKTLETSNIFSLLLGIIIGIFVMIICDSSIKKMYKKKTEFKNNSLLKTGIIVGIGLSIHNFPEGLAIGSGFEASIELGYGVALAILLHDIPEGLSQNRQYA